jgi:SAM-dependent methyltransferase
MLLGPGAAAASAARPIPTDAGMPVIEVSDSHQEEDFSLSPRVMEALWAMEDRHFWHAARNEWIVDLLRRYGARPGQRLLDVGCGGGAVLRRLASEGYLVTGVDTERRLIAKAAQRCQGVPLVVGDVARLPPAQQGPYDVIGFFDVLEHLQDPEGLMRAALRWAAPNALVVATVPALRALHTVIDDLSGHKRRYEPGELGGCFTQVGLAEVVEHGIFRSSLALLKWHRGRGRTAVPGSDEAEQLMVNNLRVPPAPVNAVMGAVCYLERRLGLAASRGKAGGSLAAVGRHKVAA